MGDVVEMPPCPRGHKSLKVTFGGTYGPAGMPPKQLYKCVPADGSKPHRFAPLLPRRQRSEGRCRECESTVHFHEGPATAREFTHPLRVAARTLGRVAEGASYVEASEAVRHTEDRGGMLAADWVEAFSADLWDALGPKHWPQFLVADTKPFYVRDWTQREDPTRTPRQWERLPRRVAFTLLVVVGADAPAHPAEKWRWRPVVAQLVPGASVRVYDWCYLFSLLPGRPLGFTSDEDHALYNAVELWWPDDPSTGEMRPALSACLFHAKERFREHVAPQSVKEPYGEVSQGLHDTLWPLWEHLADGPEQWEEFDRFLRTRMNWCAPVRAWRWRRILGIPKHQFVHEQLSRSWPRPPDSNSAAEAELRDLTQALGTHRLLSFRNAERTNRLLRLMVLARRGSYDEQTWAEVMDQALRSPARQGRPRDPLRSICDPAGQPSLR